MHLSGCSCSSRQGRLCRFRLGMDSHLAKVMPKARFHNGAGRKVERLARRAQHLMNHVARTLVPAPGGGAGGARHGLPLLAALGTPLARQSLFSGDGWALVGSAHLVRCRLKLLTLLDGRSFAHVPVPSYDAQHSAAVLPRTPEQEQSRWGTVSRCANSQPIATTRRFAWHDSRLFYVILIFLDRMAVEKSRVQKAVTGVERARCGHALPRHSGSPARWVIAVEGRVHSWDPLKFLLVHVNVEDTAETPGR
jgi:hypothetical protein